MKIKKISLIVLLIILILTIFLFSNQNGIKSEKTSDRFALTVLNGFEKIINIEIKDKESFVNNSRFIVRKLAHFTLYFLLGIITYLLLTNYIDKKVILISIICVSLFAILDEVHQLFLVGRTARVYDVLIDIIGSSTGILLADLIRKKVSNIHVHT